MPVTAFQVRSNRIHDIALPDGSTVGQLKTQLSAGGYDVNAALITINRFAEGDKLIGQVDGYVLKEGDTVEFKTEKLDLPATGLRIRKMAEEAEQAAAEQAQKCAACSRQCQAQPKYGPQVLAFGRVEVTPTIDGFIVKVRG